jgi:hypothetical protein
MALQNIFLPWELDGDIGTENRAENPIAMYVTHVVFRFNVATSLPIRYRESMYISSGFPVHFRPLV